MKLFVIKRIEDNTGLSGTGIVADGVEFDDGQVVLKWRGEISTIVIHKNLENVKKLSCSHSKSEIVFMIPLYR